jgi:diaminohydroxyphosphoribosylaminopyrimidine deaminase/5-amino-6-(5-phosphoribosylamino)uracil reductase
MNINAKMTADVAQDQKFLDAALRLAKRNQGLTGTNPSVACVIVSFSQSGPKIVGSGVTARGGRPHAEPPAIEEAGELAKGATAYVTLEPCAHHGKTPPCAQTLIDAGVARVVTAITDPDARVNGKGHEMLIKAGIEVTCMDGGMAARRVMQGYLKARTSIKPFVTLKMAMTETGLIGSAQTDNLRISSAVSSSQTHLQRARHSAILVGSGTAYHDDPSLDCRLPGLESRSPTRIILDEKARLDENATVIKTALKVPTIIVAPMSAPQEYRQMLAQNGVQHQACEMEGGRIALPELMDDLAARGIQSIMVEGGAGIAEGFINDELVDQILIHIGGIAEQPGKPEDAVYAPFTPTTMPDGFELVQTLNFGEDISQRYRKIT